jgi:SAM-dependent methyltransferase
MLVDDLLVAGQGWIEVDQEGVGALRDELVPGLVEGPHERHGCVVVIADGDPEATGGHRGFYRQGGAGSEPCRVRKALRYRGAMNDAEHFEVFGVAAASLSDATVSAGRHSFQRDSEALIAGDVVEKLRLEPSDRLLEIGCGTGNVLRPLAARVGEAVGIDHGACLAAFAPVPENVELVPGRWPQVRLEGDFSKVLAYSVLHYLTGADQAFEFIDRCVELVRPGGRILLGDLPNADAGARFAATDFGQRFLAAWADRVAAERSPEDRARDELFAGAPKLDRYIDDAFVTAVFARYRGRGHAVYVLPQPPDLAFSRTREDVLIEVRP